MRDRQSEINNHKLSFFSSHSCYSLDFLGCTHPPRSRLVIPQSSTLTFRPGTRAQCGPQLRLDPHGSTAEMGSNVNFLALPHSHCDKLPRGLGSPSAFLFRKAKYGCQHHECQPHPPLTGPCSSVRGAFPAAGPGEEGPVAAVLGEAGLSSKEESIPEALETLAPGSHGTLPA